MTESIEKPWALMRHHAGWADVFHVESETADAVTGFYPDRETVGPHVTYSARAVLARFPTLEAAPHAKAASPSGASTTRRLSRRMWPCARPNRPVKTPGWPGCPPRAISSGRCRRINQPFRIGWTAHIQPAAE